MKVTFSLKFEKEAHLKVRLLDKLFYEISTFVEKKHYGNGIFEWFIIMQIVNPPLGYEHLNKDFKPKFIEHKSLTNRLTGEPLIIEKQFNYGLKLTKEKFTEFVSSSDKESIKIIALEVLKSLSKFDLLPKSVKDFDKKKFTDDMRNFFAEQNLM